MQTVRATGKRCLLLLQQRRRRDGPLPCLLPPTPCSLSPSSLPYAISPLPPPVPQWLESGNPLTERPSFPPEIGDRCRDEGRRCERASWGRFRFVVCRRPEFASESRRTGRSRPWPQTTVAVPRWQASGLTRCSPTGGDSNGAFTFENVTFPLTLRMFFCLIRVLLLDWTQSSRQPSVQVSGRFVL